MYIDTVYSYIHTYDIDTQRLEYNKLQNYIHIHK